MGFEVNKVCSFGVDMNDCDTRGKHDLQTFFDPDLEHFPFRKDENVFKIPPLPRNFQLLAKQKQKQDKTTTTTKKTNKKKTRAKTATTKSLTNKLSRNLETSLKVAFAFQT